MPHAFTSFIFDFIATTFGVDSCKKRDSIRELRCWRELWMRELLYRDATIKQNVVHSPKEKSGFDMGDQVQIHSLGRIRIIAGADPQSFLSSNFTSSSLLAELRGWQEAVHVISCIDATVAYLSIAISEGTDPLTDHICDTMVATIRTLIPPKDLQPAHPRPDDLKRAVDCRVFFDEPGMQDLISSLDESSRLYLETAAERDRLGLPLFPTHFGGSR